MLGRWQDDNSDRVLVAALVRIAIFSLGVFSNKTIFGTGKSSLNECRIILISCHLRALNINPMNITL